MYFDTHAHFDDEAFDIDREELLNSLISKGVELIIDPGCTVESSRASLSLSEKYAHIYSAVGIHPEELSTLEDGSLAEIRALAAHQKCVAIGEIGLDYYWDNTRKTEQRALFRAQIELALELDKPVIVHDRDAHGDCLEMVREYDSLKGVFHCFSGSTEMARELLKRGWYLGFDGPVTYKNARKAIEVLELCPIDRILIETDSPYLSPAPMRGRRNDSSNLPFVVKKIAEVKGISEEEVCAVTAANGKRLFNL